MTEAPAAQARPKTTTPPAGAPIRFRAIAAILVLVPSTVFFMVWGNWRIGGTGPMDAINGPGPLHPLAFPLAFSWTIDSMLPAIFITWVFKVLLLRYGGLRAHRRALPFFLALLAGTACISLLRTLLLRFLGLEHR
jgi:hypothetical protein